MRFQQKKIEIKNKNSAKFQETHSIRLFSNIIPRRIIVARHENSPSTKTIHPSTPNSFCAVPNNLSIMSTFLILGTRIRPIIIPFTLRDPCGGGLSWSPATATAPEDVLTVWSIRML
jgi:hypothetical protein